MVTVLHRDSHIVICLKPVGVSSQEGGLPDLLRKQLQAQEVYPVHRLDKAVGGVMVYALTKTAAAVLSRAVQERTLHKTYLAVLEGVPQQPQAVLEDLLFHDKMKNKTYVVKKQRKGVKDAKLSYRMLQNAHGKSLVHVHLFTGRTHQIRVQFASRKLPLTGDGRYGAKQSGSNPALWSYSLDFAHPVTGEKLYFSHLPPMEEPWVTYESGMQTLMQEET